MDDDDFRMRCDVIYERARDLEGRAETWADFSNAIFSPGTGLIAEILPDIKDRRKFYNTEEYLQVNRMVRRLQDKFGLVEGATPKSK